MEEEINLSLHITACSSNCTIINQPVMVLFTIIITCTGTFVGRAFRAELAVSCL